MRSRQLLLFILLLLHLLLIFTLLLLLLLYFFLLLFYPINLAPLILSKCESCNLSSESSSVILEPCTCSAPRQDKLLLPPLLHSFLPSFLCYALFSFLSLYLPPFFLFLTLLLYPFLPSFLPFTLSLDLNLFPFLLSFLPYLLPSSLQVFLPSYLPLSVPPFFPLSLSLCLSFLSHSLCTYFFPFLPAAVSEPRYNVKLHCELEHGVVAELVQ